MIVIDDDQDVRESLGRLLRSVSLQARLYGSVAEFLSAGRPDGASCLVLDVRLPGQGGLDFQRELSSAGIQTPIVFITGYVDLTALKEVGEDRIVQKPFREADLAEKIGRSLRTAYG